MNRRALFGALAGAALLPTAPSATPSTARTITVRLRAQALGLATTNFDEVVRLEASLLRERMAIVRQYGVAATAVEAPYLAMPAAVTGLFLDEARSP